MADISPRQQRILDYIESFIAEKDYPPSIRDIQMACQVSSTSVVDYNLRVLEQKGYMRRDREVSRGIQLRRRMPQPLRVPLLGQIAAGQPIPVPTEETWVSPAMDTVEVSPELVRGHHNVYALRVQGTSMIDALINDGDIVLMEATAAAEEGDMVAAWLLSQQETTLKRLYHEGDRIRLQPANQQVEPIYTPAANVAVQGRVIGVLRRL